MAKGGGEPAWHDVKIGNTTVRQDLWVVRSCLVIAVLLLPIPRWPQIRLLALTLLVVAAARLMALWSSPVGYRVDPDGLTEARWPRFRTRRWPWSAVRGVRVQRDGLRIELDSGPLELGDAVPTWAQLGEQIRTAQRIVEAQPGPSVPPEQVVAWLGLADGEALRVRSHDPWATGAYVALWGVLATLWVHGLPVAATWVALVPALAIGAAVVLGWRRRMRLLADVHGLHVRDRFGARTYPWDTVRAASWSWATGVSVLQVVTTHGTLVCRVAGTGATRLVAAIERLLDARDAGAVLPRDVGPSDTALSRPTVTVAAGRGLSRSEEDAGLR